MKSLLIGCCLLVGGCCTTPKEPVIIEVPVYTKPSIEMPARPTMQNSGVALKDVVIDAETNSINLMEYATKLENILNTLK